MLKLRYVLPAVSLFSLGAGMIYGPRLMDSFAPALEYSGHGSSIEPAATVAEQTERADLVVRARVVTTENRVLSEILPVYAEDGLTVLEERETRTPFTDVTFEVLETLKGESASIITVLQTGGVLKEGRFARAQKFALAADPLFERDSEHFLFLVEITGDGVHSTDRTLYRVVNPLGRYQIERDGNLLGPDRYERIADAVLVQLPENEETLRQQVDRALGERGEAKGQPIIR